MNRSDFYYRQIVTEGEMDQAFDDCENADQDIVEMLCKAGGWGVLDGLELTPQGSPDLTLNLSAGTAYDVQGRRIYLAALSVLDFTSHVDPTNSRMVRVEIEVNRATSDPRLDGNSNPLDYRSEETVTVTLNPGPADGSNDIPARSANKVSVGVVFLSAGTPIIISSDIETWWYADAAASDPSISAEPHRDIGGFLPRAGHIALDVWGGDHGVMSFNPNDQLEIFGIELLNMRTAAQGGAANALDTGNRSIVNVNDLSFDSGSGGNGYIAMGAAGIGGDIRFVDQFEFDATSPSNPALDMSDRNIGSVDQLLFSASGGDPALDLNGRDIEDVDALVFDASGANPALDLNGRNIAEVEKLTMKSGGGTQAIDMNNRGIEEASRLTIDAGSAANPALSMATKNIGFVDQLSFSSGPTTAAILASGRDINSQGGDINTLAASGDGSVVVGNGGEFRYGSGEEKVQRVWLTAADAIAATARWTFFPSLDPNFHPYWVSDSLSTTGYERVLFPVHLPQHAIIVSYALKLREISYGNTSMQMMRNIPNFDLSTTAPSTLTILSEATVTTTINSGTYPGVRTIQDVLSSEHNYHNGYAYYVVVTPSTAIGAIVYGVEVIYKIDEVRAGLH